MGNIINPSPGDLADRQSILQLKIERCGIESDTGYSPVSNEILEQDFDKAVNRIVLLEKNPVDINPFLIENEAIQKRLEMDWFPKLTEYQASEFDTEMDRLRSVNSELWRLEDQARILRAAPDKRSETVRDRKAETLDAITINNEIRAGLVKRINALWGIYIQEKQYVG